MPHRPRWGLTQGSRFTNLAACEDYLSFGLPPAERVFQHSRPRADLDADYISALANTVSSGQEIVREWRSMQTEWDAFEADHQVFDEEKEKIRHEVSTLRWKLSDAEKNAAAEASKKARADYEAACARDNARLEAAREAGGREIPTIRSRQH